MRWFAYAGLAVLFVLSVTVPAPAAAEDAMGASLALHVTAAGTAQSACGALPADTPGDPLHCTEYRVQWPLQEAAVVYLVVVGHASGTEVGAGNIASVSLGIDYDVAALSQVVWILCADMEAPAAGGAGAWPLPGSGNRIQWDPVSDCQDTAVFGGTYCWGDLWNTHALAGAFYVTAYGDDVFQVTANAAVEPAECYYQDCAGTRFDFWPLGAYEGCAVGFGASVGMDCSKDMPVPVRATTWGGLKNLY